MPEQAMEPVKIENIKDKIQERIRGMVVDLIPEEQWNTLVEQQVEYFFRDPPTRQDYGKTVRGHGPLVLKELIQEEVESRLRVLVKEELDKPQWRGNIQWMDNAEIHSPGSAVNAFLKQNLSEIVSLAIGHLVSGTAQMAVDTIQTKLREQSSMM